MKPAQFGILALISVGCAVEANTPQNGDNFQFGSSGAAGDTTGAAGSTGFGTGGAGTAGATVIPQAGAFTNPFGGGSGGDASFGGTFGAGTGSGGAATGGAAAGGTAPGSAGKSSGGAAGTAAGGSATAGSGGTGVVVGPYCDTAQKAPLPYTVNEGFQPSGWQGDITAISVPTVAPNACDTRAAGSVGTCTVWRFTPNAATPAWAGVGWSKQWDPNYKHPDVCLAAGATKITFQARGMNGGEQVVFSGAGAAEPLFTLTNAWKEYEVSLAGVNYNTVAEGVTSGFFWKVAPPTPAGAPVTFFVDDIQFVK